MIDIKEFSKHSIHNRDKIKSDEKVSCYYCQSVYLGKYITEWIDSNDTALCECGVDSVVPFEVDKEILKLAHDYWFGGYKNKLKEDVKNVPGVNFIEEE